MYRARGNNGRASRPGFRSLAVHFEPKRSLDDVKDLDLIAMRNAFFSTPADPNWNADADFDVNGIVNFGDAEVMKRLFFGAPGPSGLSDPCS